LSYKVRRWRWQKRAFKPYFVGCSNCFDHFKMPAFQQHQTLLRRAAYIAPININDFKILAPPSRAHWLQ
jgi:hypothetical protein